jgi:primase-polymerase (primpol)-like protein
MTYRILGNGERFRVQERVGWFGWADVKHFVSMGGDHIPYFAITTFATEQEAIVCAETKWGTSANRHRTFKVV